jgi:hypothetical protein
MDLEQTHEIGHETLAAGRSEVERHLRSALTHIASAEALLSVDGNDNQASARTLTDQIITRTVEIVELVSEHDSSLSPQGETAELEEPETLAIVDWSALHKSSGAIEISSNGNSANGSTPQAPEDRSVMEPANSSASKSTNEESSEIEKQISLTDREKIIFEDFVVTGQAGQWFKSGDVRFPTVDFPSDYATSNAIRKFFKKLTDMGLVSHNGRQKNGSRYLINDQAMAELAELFPDEEACREAEQPEQPIAGRTETQSAQQNEQPTNPDTETTETATPFSLIYQGDIGDPKTRRNDFLKVDNLDDFNERIDKANTPYGKLPVVVIESPRELTVDGKKISLSDDQKELFNILLSEFDQALTMAEIQAIGFGEHYTPKEAMRKLVGSISRLSETLLGDDRQPLLIGDVNSGYQLNPIFLLRDHRQESVKKK